MKTNKMKNIENIKSVGDSLLIHSLRLIEEMIDNHDADAVRMIDA